MGDSGSSMGLGLQDDVAVGVSAQFFAPTYMLHTALVFMGATWHARVYTTCCLALVTISDHLDQGVRMHRANKLVRACSLLDQCRCRAHGFVNNACPALCPEIVDRTLV